MSRLSLSLYLSLTARVNARACACVCVREMFEFHGQQFQARVAMGPAPANRSQTAVPCNVRACSRRQAFVYGANVRAALSVHLTSAGMRCT